MLNFIKEHIFFIFDTGLAIITGCLLYIFIRKLIKPIYYFPVIIGYLALMATFLFFDLILLAITSSFVLLIFIFILILVGMNGNKKANFALTHSKIFVKNKVKKNKTSTLLYDELKDAVLYLSETKTGAIITLEKNISLENYIKEGVEINCPVKKELLTTIFYSGTPLHDGAVVIRDDIICAASVYYQPATTAMPGRYGARHRAALGISLVTDALTIVVSEETGRISFVEKGELETVTRDRFSTILEEKLKF